jgi:hypothetical protein
MYGSFQADWVLIDIANDNWTAHTLGCCYQAYTDYFPGEWDMIREYFSDTAITLVEYRQTFIGPESRDWFNLMRNFDDHIATNARDHVYGLLALANAEYAAKIVPDYEADVSRVHTQSMQAMLDEHHGDLRPLTRHIFNTGRLGLPSWVPSLSLTHDSFHLGSSAKHKR